jgi:hypothetical protein
MSCLLPTALNKASARCVPKKPAQVDEVRRMEFCLMNVTSTAVRCYSVNHMTAETKRTLPQHGNTNQRNSNRYRLSYWENKVVNLLDRGYTVTAEWCCGTRHR